MLYHGDFSSLLQEALFGLGLVLRLQTFPILLGRWCLGLSQGVPDLLLVGDVEGELLLQLIVFILMLNNLFLINLLFFGKQSVQLISLFFIHSSLISIFSNLLFELSQVLNLYPIPISQFSVQVIDPSLQLIDLELILFSVLILFTVQFI